MYKSPDNFEEIKRKNMKNNERGCNCRPSDGLGDFLKPDGRKNKYNFWSKRYGYEERWYYCSICHKISYYKIFKMED